MGYQIEVVAQENNSCGEAPTWDAGRNRVIWTDNEKNLVYEFLLATCTTRIISRGLMVSGIALHSSGALVFGGTGGLHVWQSQDNYRTIASEHNDETLWFNDIIADHAGRVYAGTMHWGAGGMEQLGRLYLFGTDGSISVVDEGIELSNGLAFSPDNRTLYFSDSSARKIYAYDVDPSGRLSRKRLFVEVPRDEGIPDGMTVDAAGFVWSAQWYGAQLVRYDPEGKVERRMAMPVKQVSSLIFGGPDLTDIYVTSAGNSWGGPYAPPGYDFDAPNIGGPLYRVRTEIQGRPEHLAAV